jgi:hypothetical protein
MSKTPVKPLRAVFGESDLVAPLMAQHRRLSRLQQSFVKTLPEGWETLCRVAALEGSSVVIAAANGAVATNLKAFSPRLLENFKELLGKKTAKEQELTAIRIVVQPEISTWRTPTPTAIRLNAQKTRMSGAQLDDLARELGDSPLKRAVEKLKIQRELEAKREANPSAAQARKRGPTNKT